MTGKITYTLEEIQDLANTAVEDMGEKAGHMYVGWYLINGPRIVKEWFGTDDISQLDIKDLQKTALLQHMLKEYEEWLIRD